MTNYHEIVEKQRAYFKTGETKKLEVRKELLNAVKRCGLENAHELCEAVHRDLRRLPAVTEAMEIGGMQEIDYILERLDEWAAPTKVECEAPLTDKDEPMLVKDPKGVVLVIGTWNYPVAMMFMPLAAALSAGNTVILKPSEVAPNVAEVFGRIIPKYFDEKVVAIVQGGVSETTSLLEERFDHIFFTGDPRIGKVIMTAAAKHLTSVTLELGGKCPVVIADDADLEKAAKDVATKKWMNCGQTCIAPDYALVSSETKPKFVEELKKAIAENFSEDVKSSPAYSRMINQRHFDRVKSVMDKSKASVLIKAGELDREDVFIPPMVLDADAEDSFMEAEIFGPVLPIVTSENMDSTIEFINEGEKPLAAYIWTTDKKNVERLYKETSSGAVTANGVMSHIMTMALPFGGVGNSGMGRYRGKFGFDEFTHEKAVLLRDLC
ncbi:hypothetical protein QR680_007904 [Steinernema hermaphroditum]|uniref:Aldehyde dehydrogenase n=1 Tax=Steinernema hermaphroditum TaxID=289476 RepID=A0AA39M748_9BILA|nr:hypothetical protein QR680_007904 [Steinernema hermaphroditum]